MTSTAITTHKQQAITAIADESELIRILQGSLYPQASMDSVAMAIGYCRATGLDVMQKPVHIVPMWDSQLARMRDVIMPGIGLYRIQASRNGCAGISEPEFGEDTTETIGGQKITFPKWCKVTVLRKLDDGSLASFTALERWTENYAMKGGKERSVAPNAMWTRRPYAQLAKCAEAQALRKAFPELGSQATAEELEGKTIDPDQPIPDLPVIKHGNGAIKPTSGAMDNIVDVQRREAIETLSKSVIECFVADDVESALDAVEDAGLDSEEMVALWSLLGAYSKQRSAMKALAKGRQELRVAQEAAQATKEA